MANCPKSLVDIMRQAVVDEILSKIKGGKGQAASSPGVTGGVTTDESESSGEEQASSPPRKGLSSLKVIDDCDGRRHHLTDLKGANRKMRDTLAFVRMCEGSRLSLALDDEGITLDAYRYKELLQEKANHFMQRTSFYGREVERNVLSSGVPFASTVLLSGVLDLPVFKKPYWERFLNGKWKRDD